MTPPLTDIQLDALKELANIASGTAATALSQMLGREVELNVPRALALPMADAVDACGPAEQPMTGVAIGVEGDLPALVMLLIPAEHAESLCAMLGVEAGTALGDSALREIGNILGTSYLNGIGAMTGLELDPGPPQLAIDMLGAIVSTVFALTAGASDTVLVLDSELDVQGEACAISFLLLPIAGGIVDLLAPLGLAEPA